jgi:uncharacterized protein YeaO (DUF488 family)
MSLTIALKRAYDKPAKGDGFRALVDRLWPRGVTKERLRIDLWAKALAPSTALRKWFGHDPEKWPEFRRRYKSELSSAAAKQLARELLEAAARDRTLTLVYAAKDSEHNEAVVLRDYLERMLAAAGARLHA